MKNEALALAREKMKGFAGFTGLQVESVEPGKSTVYYDITEDHLNSRQIVHGGVTFTLMDVAAGLSGSLTEEGTRELVSSSADVHFLRPGSLGRLTAKGELIKEGHTLALSRVDVSDDQGVLIATGTFELYFV